MRDACATSRPAVYHSPRILEVVGRVALAFVSTTKVRSLARALQRVCLRRVLQGVLMRWASARRAFVVHRWYYRLHTCDTILLCGVGALLCRTVNIILMKKRS